MYTGNNSYIIESSKVIVVILEIGKWLWDSTIIITSYEDLKIKIFIFYASLDPQRTNTFSVELKKK